MFGSPANVVASKILYKSGTQIPECRFTVRCNSFFSDFFLGSATVDFRFISLPSRYLSQHEYLGLRFDDGSKTKSIQDDIKIDAQ